MSQIDKDYFKTPNKSDGIEYGIDETELWVGRPKKGAYILENSIKFAPIGILWGAIDISVLLVIIANVSLEFIIPILAFMAIHMIPCWIWIGSIIKASKKSNELQFIITNERIITYNRIAKFIENEVYLKDLTEVILKRSTTDRWCGVGDVMVIGKKGVVMIYDQPDASYLEKKLRALIVDADTQKFYSSHNICSYCGSTIDKKLTKCPYCGGNIKKL